MAADLKMKVFEPEFAGKMNFYLSASMTSCAIRMTSPALASSFAKPGNGSLANTLCGTSTSRLAYPEYRLAESLPEKLQGSLPTIEELEMNWGRHPKTNPSEPSPSFLTFFERSGFARFGYCERQPFVLCATPT